MSTLTPAGTGPPEAHPWWCLGCGAYAGADAVANVGLFVPLGAVLRTRGARWRAAATIGAALSVAVELAQGAGIPGRDAALRDVLANAAGTAVGAWAAARLAGGLHPRPGAARRLGAGALVAWLATTALGAWLLGRDTGATGGPLRASAGLAVPPFGWYGGEVLAAEVDTWRSGPRRAGTGPVSVAGALGRVTTAAARLRGGDYADRVVPFLYVHDDAGRLLLSLAQAGPDVVVFARRRADRWRLREPQVRLANALAPLFRQAPGSEATVRVRLAADTVAVAVAAGGRVVREASVVGPGAAWSLVVPLARVNGAERALVTAALLAGLLAPFGYWSWWGTRDLTPIRRAGWWATAWVGVAGGLWAAPAAAGMTPAGGGEWAAAAGAVASGWLWAVAVGARGARGRGAPACSAAPAPGTFDGCTPSSPRSTSGSGSSGS